LLWRRRRQLGEALRKQRMLLLLFGWFAVTTLWALDPNAAGRRLFLYALTLICVLGLALGLGDRRRLHRGLAIAALAMIGIDLASWILLPGLSMTELGLAAIHTQKNQLGAAMLFCCLVIGTYLFTVHKAVARLAWAAALAAGFVLLAASASKTSLAIMGGLMILSPLVLWLLKQPLSLSRALGASLLLILVVASVGWLAYCTATGADPSEPIQGITFSQRTDLWSFILSEIAKRPLTGAGFDSFWDIDPKVQPSLGGELWFGSAAIANEAHNGYLDLLATTGVPGFIGAMVLLFRWIGRSLAGLRASLFGADTGADWPSAFLLAAFPLLLFVHNFMESSYFTANQVFGSLILLIGVQIDMGEAARPRDVKVLSRTTKSTPITATSSS
jgi:O-antigen ligase